MAYRIDVSKLDGPKIDSNGFLQAEAKFTRTGVFPYLRFDGSISYELRHPDDVFEKESLDSCSSLVVTNDHPPMMLYSDNAKDYCAGFTCEKVDVLENKFIAGSMKVIDEKAITDVMQGGKNQISMGYRCDVVEEAGMFEGIQYNARQKNIRYNHVSLVWEGRAGPEVSIKTDSSDVDFAVMKMDCKKSACKQERLGVQSDNKSDKTMEQNMPAKIKIDSVEFEVSETVAQAVQSKLDSIETLKKDLTSSKDEVSKAQASADALKSEIAKRDQEIEALKKDMSDDAILAKADHLSKIRSFAKEVLGEDKTDTIENLKKAVVEKKAGIDCSKKDSVYIDAAFETLMLSHKPESKKDVLAETIENVAGNKTDSVSDKIKAHMDGLANRWKQVKK